MPRARSFESQPAAAARRPSGDRHPCVFPTPPPHSPHSRGCPQHDRACSHVLVCACVGGEGRRGEGKSQIRGDARLLMTRRQRPRARRVTRLGGFEKPSGRRPSFEGLGQAGSRKDSFISRIALSAFKSLRCISNHTDGGVRSCGRCENESVHLREARGASSSASSRAQPHMDFGVGGGPAPAPRLRAPRNTCRLISRVTLPPPPPEPPLGLCFEKMPEVVFIIPEQSPRGRSVARRTWQMAT